jgi:flagellar hook protein FlgE
MNSAVSGLKAHQIRMDVIGNNIANVNTIAFKSGRVTFSEIFSQTLSGASAPDSANGRGGTNPKQIGLGLAVNAIDTLTTRGGFDTTDNPNDMAIDGDGYFICKSGDSPFQFTRAGNFSIDPLGNLTTGNGMLVYGWQKLKDDGSGEFDTESEIEPLNLYSDDYRNKRVIPASATSIAKIAGNLDAATKKAAEPPTDSDYFSVPMTIYDSLGNDYEIHVKFCKTGVGTSGSTWSWTIDTGDPDFKFGAGTGANTITFTDKGLIKDGTAKTFEVKFTPPESSGTGDFTVNFDFSKLTSFASDNSVKPMSVDGYRSGSLVYFTVGSDGILTGVYDNGKQQTLGMVAVTTFENAAGLQKVGQNMYLNTTNSGNYKAVKPGTNGSGAISPGTLEMSNVDLSKEFTDMIITQRGFQANSRIITTSDEMLQELVNLKR